MQDRCEGIQQSRQDAMRVSVQSPEMEKGRVGKTQRRSQGERCFQETWVRMARRTEKMDQPWSAPEIEQPGSRQRGVGKEWPRASRDQELWAGKSATVHKEARESLDPPLPQRGRAVSLPGCPAGAAAWHLLNLPP